MKHPMRALFTLAVTTLLVTSACKSLGTPEEQAQADTLWDSLDGYESWGFFDGHEGINKGASPHGPYVRIFLNDIGANAQDELPFGTVVVKENFARNDEGTLKGVTIMQRIQGYDPENYDWFYARFKPSGEQTHSGKVASCIDCHFDAEEDDFIFLND